RIMHKSAEAMKQASAKVPEYRRQILEEGQVETEAGAELTKAQHEALRRLEQLVAALKPENGVPLRPRGGQNGGGEGGGGGGGGDGIPALAQLKLLRSLQADVNKRTEEFGKLHPDPDKFTDKDKAELQSIRKEQQEIAELLEQLITPMDPQGDK